MDEQRENRILIGPVSAMERTRTRGFRLLLGEEWYYGQGDLPNVNGRRVEVIYRNRYGVNRLQRIDRREDDGRLQCVWERRPKSD